MKRRDVLTTTAAIAVAGCLGGDGGGSGTETTAESTTSGTETDAGETVSGATTTEASERETETRAATEIQTATETTSAERTASENGTETARGTTVAGVTSREFTVENANGTPGNEASVRFETGGSRVVVTGTITGSDGCQTAVLDSVQAGDSGLQITVATERDAGASAVCSQALVGIEYRLVVTLETPPASVRVVHRGSDGSSEVAALGRGG